jgi:hypothetical protein
MFLCFQVLSTGLGRIVPNLISRKHTNNAATGVHTSYFREGHEWDYLSVDIGWLEIDNWVYSLHYKLV